jgi:hypothetical protein
VELGQRREEAARVAVFGEMNQMTHELRDFHLGLEGLGEGWTNHRPDAVSGRSLALDSLLVWRRRSRT